MKGYYEAQTIKYINGDLLRLVRWGREPHGLEEHRSEHCRDAEREGECGTSFKT